MYLLKTKLKINETISNPKTKLPQNNSKDQLQFEAIQIPSLVARGASFWLACEFALAPSDAPLYSVKWYKNNEEFYRLIANESLIAAQATQSSLQFNIASQRSHFLSQSLGPAQQFFAQSGLNVLVSCVCLFVCYILFCLFVCLAFFLC